ncbi:hypothetical protein CRG98_002378 [Punica granatum]|uniref:Uncharacterized protein n=1 Tax=Punica granatum TaxID=22663 RepID=A0A2I0L985_PUNGR|nr:hypothetical protein CRG98_002378 [Punica granatum]
MVTPFFVFQACSRRGMMAFESGGLKPKGLGCLGREPWTLESITFQRGRFQDSYDPLVVGCLAVAGEVDGADQLKHLRARGKSHSHHSLHHTGLCERHSGDASSYSPPLRSTLLLLLLVILWLFIPAPPPSLPISSFVRATPLVYFPASNPSLLFARFDSTA